MSLVLTLICLVILATILVAVLYTLGTYLLLAYDRRLAAHGQVSPDYTERESFPRKWKRPRAILVECIATLLAIWFFPLGVLFSHTWRHRKHKRRPILLVHGFLHNQSAWLWIRRQLARAGHGPLYSLNLYPPSGPIPQFAKEIERLAKRIEEETGQYKLILIGHSMGGLVSSYYAEYLAPPGKVTHVIAISSPLQGTRNAYMAGKACARQMRPDSDLIGDLSKRIATNQSIRYGQIASQFDNMIFPYQSSLCGTDTRHQRTLSSHGHMTLLYSPVVVKQILEWLRETERVPPGAHTHDPDQIAIGSFAAT